MKKPPEVIKIVMQVVCMLLDVEPVEAREGKDDKPVLSYWQAAIGPDVLGDPRLPEVLMSYDRNKLTAELMMDIDEVLASEHFSYEKAFKASSAATGIFQWVKSTRDYFIIYQEIQPRRDAFFKAQKQMEEKEI